MEQSRAKTQQRRALTQSEHLTFDINLPVLSLLVVQPLESCRPRLGRKLCVCVVVRPAPRLFLLRKGRGVKPGRLWGSLEWTLPEGQTTYLYGRLINLIKEALHCDNFRRRFQASAAVCRSPLHRVTARHCMRPHAGIRAGLGWVDGGRLAGRAYLGGRREMCFSAVRIYKRRPRCPCRRSRKRCCFKSSPSLSAPRRKALWRRVGG